MMLEFRTTEAGFIAVLIKRDGEPIWPTDEEQQTIIRALNHPGVNKVIVDELLHRPPNQEGNLS